MLWVPETRAKHTPETGFLSNQGFHWFCVDFGGNPTCGPPVAASRAVCGEAASLGAEGDHFVARKRRSLRVVTGLSVFPPNSIQHPRHMRLDNRAQPVYNTPADLSD